MNHLQNFSNNQLYVLVAKASTTGRNRYELGKCSIVTTISSCIQDSRDFKRLGGEAAGLLYWPIFEQAVSGQQSGRVVEGSAKP